MPPRARRRRMAPAVLASVGIAATLAGCGADAAAGSREARDRWAEQGSDTYTYELEASCGERALYGRFEVTVVDGEVAELTGLDESGRASANLPTLMEYVPTIGGLLDRVATEVGSVKEAEFDQATGMPTWVFFDPIPNGIDDEECYRLSDLEPGA